ncbi:hypothetical protein [Tolypothrix sp. VBCCA 56010]|uniref:hypothetical protein n=1 Tax=Tolypothrix sp. VBCCA 56010 TaxID=3137731 RepID=UPI003D7C7D27
MKICLSQCPMPHDGRCLNGGNLRTALPPQCPMPNAPCPMSNAPCPMPHAPCPLPNAQCPMPHFQVKMQKGNRRSPCGD